MVVSVPHFQWGFGEWREGKTVLEVKKCDATQPEMEQKTCDLEVGGGYHVKKEIIGCCVVLWHWWQVVASGDKCIYIRSKHLWAC